MVGTVWCAGMRIIPARAGFTLDGDLHECSFLDHPRSRGVYGVRHVVDATLRGSSPLARGLPATRPDGTPTKRIIPARAGFTIGEYGRRRVVEDHPRSRGVYTVIVRYLSVTVGSSPLARGLHARIDSHVADLGIIPARAGFTRYPRSLPSRLWDHPRSRGVYVQPGRVRQYRPGSSPLARGLPRRGWVRWLGCGIIPARAGFTRALSPSLGTGWDHPRSRGVYRGNKVSHLV